MLDQIEAAAGGPIPTWFAEDFRVLTGQSKRSFYGDIGRFGRVVDMRAFINGEVKPTGRLMLLIRETHEGLLIQLWERIETR